MALPLSKALILVAALGTMVEVVRAVELKSSSSEGVVTIPLVPYHVVKQRLLATGRTFETLQGPSHSKYHYYNRFLTTGGTADPKAAEAALIASLFQGYGTHYADLWCGTPPQRQTVVIDTGSGATAFPCHACTDCGVPDYHTGPLFDENASATFKKLSCNECLRGSCESAQECWIGMSYQDGSSWSAYEAVDTCYVGGFHDRPVQGDGKPPDNLDPFQASAFAFDMKFGCETSVKGQFMTQLEDGIMGMGVASAAFWWQMFQAGKVSSESFSLCFSRQDEVARTGTEAGAMSLGGTDERLHQTPMVYSVIEESSGFYVVHVRKVYLRQGGGGVPALSTDSNVTTVQLNISEDALNSGSVIVDSGTTNTYFSYQLAVPFGQAFTELTGEYYGHSFTRFTPEQLAQQPTILFQLSGDEILNQAVLDRSATGSVVGLAGDLDPDHPFDIILAIPPEHYYEYDPIIDGYVARFYIDEDSGGVLGANAMMGHDVYFDIGGLRIGWAESTCNYTMLTNSTVSRFNSYKDTGEISGSNADEINSTETAEPNSSGSANNIKSIVIGCLFGAAMGVFALLI
jgi:Xylanase inhibitor N-terminal